MANRKTCAWCRFPESMARFRADFAFYLHSTLCPEHKRLRNRLQRRAAGEGDTRP